MWITNEIREAIVDRQAHITRYLNTGHAIEYEQAKELRRRVNLLIDNSKQDQITAAYQDNFDGHKKFWERISTLLKPKETGTRAEFVHHATGETVQEGDAANYFNEFFSNVGSRMADAMGFDDDNIPDVQYDVQHNCGRLEIEYSGIEKLINGINVGKSSGIDGINCKVLKDTLLILVPQMVSIYRNSLQEGIFPDKWASSTVVPIPKSGELNKIGNWRPINLLPVPGRLLEKCVHSHIMKHLKNNDLLTPCQYGFRPGLGTADALFHFSSYIYDELDKRKSLAICFVDGSKAFDSVHHSLLIKKCKALKIDKLTISWLRYDMGYPRGVPSVLLCFCCLLMTYLAI